MPNNDCVILRLTFSYHDLLQYLCRRVIPPHQFRSVNDYVYPEKLTIVERLNSFCSVFHTASQTWPVLLGSDPQTLRYYSSIYSVLLQSYISFQAIQCFPTGSALPGSSISCLCKCGPL